MKGTERFSKMVCETRLNEGRIIKPDGPLKAIIPSAKIDMLKMSSFISKHLSK